MAYNEYMSGFINKKIYNKNNYILKSSPNNDNRVTPAYSGNPLLYANRSNIYPLNYPNTIKRPSTNIYELSIPRIRSNNPQNNISSKYKISTLNSNSFSPLIPKVSHLSNISNDNNNQKINRNYSSPYLNIKKPKKTLILDLDETLVHSGFNPFTRKSDINLIINIDGRDHVINVLKRPHLDEFLKEMREYYEIIVFTASVPEYASPLLDKLDQNNYLSGRLFRQDCLFNQGLYIKDLKRIGKDLKDMIIIDNNPISYADNEDNGIPILTWYDDLNDNELIKLIPLLKYLTTVNDVRPIIRQIVNRQANEVDFHIVNKIINNKIYENEMVAKNNLYNQNNINYRLNGSKYNDENRSSNIINNRFRNYLDAYNANKYNNNNLNSFSNMTLSEIKNETITINNNNNYYQGNNEKNEQNYNYKNYNENIMKKNNYENILEEDREIPSEENQNSLLYKYNVDNIRYKKMEITNIKHLPNNNNSILDRINSPNRNLERDNLYYNNNPNINSYNNPYDMEEKNYKKINNYQVKESIYRFSNNFNNKSSIDIFSSNKKNNDIKVVKDNDNINNNPIKTSENKNRGISDYYLQSYKKHLLRRPRSNSFNYRHVNKTNIENDENNNPNYMMSSKNDNINNMNGINRNNNSIYYDKNMLVDNRNNNNRYTNYNSNLNKSGTNDNINNGNSFINEDNDKSINYHINEKKLNYKYNLKAMEENNDNNDNKKYYSKVIKPNLDENNINRSNENYRDFLKNYLRNSKNNNENEFNDFSKNENNKKIYKRNSINLINEKDNNLNKTFSTENNIFSNNFSSNKNYEHKKYNYNYNLYYFNNEQKNENNLKNSILKNDFEHSYYNNIKTDNENLTNKSNIISEEKGNNNYESFILSQKKENIDNNINNIYYKINNFILNNIKRKQNIRYNPSEKYKKYLHEIKRKGDRNFPILNNNNNYSFFKNHNDIDSDKGRIRTNFNNYIIKLRNNNLNNISNISHKVNFIKDRQKEIDIDKSIENIKRMNKSYSDFHPKINNKFIGNEIENKFLRNKNIDKINQYKYYYRNNNDQSNDFDRKILFKENSLNRFSFNRIRNKFLNDYYNNNIQ